MNKKIVGVSIVTANFNNGPYLADFIKSVVESEVWPKELIFVDDGSTDDSMEKLEKYRKYDWLKIIPIKQNVGFANALNVGISIAQCDYILRIDPDDTLAKERIKQQYEFLSSNPECGVVGSNAYYFKSNSDSKIFKTNFPLTFPEIRTRYLKGEHGLLHGTVMGKINLFKEHLYLQENVPSEDYDIFARMLKSGAKFSNLEGALTGVRIHDSSVSNTIKMETITRTFKLRDNIFKTKTSKLQIQRYYYHILFYRKYLFMSNLVQKMGYLFLSSLFYPEKAIRRIF